MEIATCSSWASPSRWRACRRARNPRSTPKVSLPASPRRALPLIPMDLCLLGIRVTWREVKELGHYLSPAVFYFQLRWADGEVTGPAAAMIWAGGGPADQAVCSPSQGAGPRPPFPWQSPPPQSRSYPRSPRVLHRRLLPAGAGGTHFSNSLGVSSRG